MSDVTVPELNSYDRTMTVAPDDIMSVRAVLLCSYAVGSSTVRNISLCDDVLSAIDCARTLGAKIVIDGNTAHIDGAPFGSCALYCGSSAETARLLTGLLSGVNGVFTIDGDSSLRSIPVDRIVEPLRLMGARINDTDGHFPIKIIGSPLGWIEYFMPVASAHVKSVLLFAALNSSSTVTVTEKIKTPDHTEKILAALGGEITMDGNTVKCSNSVLFGNDITVSDDMQAGNGACIKPSA